MKASDWIKVTDRLPEEGTPNVIVLKKRHLAYLGIYDYEGFHINGNIIPNDDILCYMTLVPPNEEQEMKECYKPKTSDEIQKASEQYLWRTNIENTSVQDHFIAGAEWMKESSFDGKALLYAVAKTEERTKKKMIEKACEWITEHIDIPYEGEFIEDSPVASDYIEWCEKRLEYAKAIADAFKQAMEE